MYPNVLCFTCGRPLGHLYGAFRAMCIKHQQSQRAHEPIGYILDQLNVTSPCCRVRLMTNMEFKHYYYGPAPPADIPTITLAPREPGKSGKK